MPHRTRRQINAKDQEIEQHKLDLEFSRITAAIAAAPAGVMLTVGNLVNATEQVETLC